MSILMDFAVGFWGTLAEMAPYLLFGFLVAGILSVFISARVVERHLGGTGFWPILKASLFGVPLPLCSCGVIPVSMSLHKHGASKSSTLAFLLSTPQTGVDSILVTWSLLGPFFAIVRPVTALITGFFGGQLVHLAERKADGGAEMATRVVCQDPCCAEEEKKKSKVLRVLKHGFVTLPKDIGGSLLVGIAIAGLITALVPDDFFSVRLAAGGGIVAMLLMMVVGIPLYVCATASVPVAAALIAKGLSPGAALVFLMTGPATNAAAFTTIWGTLGRKTALIYLLTVVVCSLGFGLMLDYFLRQWAQADLVHAHGEMTPGLLGHLSAVALLAILIYGWVAQRFGGGHAAESEEPKSNLSCR